MESPMDKLEPGNLNTHIGAFLRGSRREDGTQYELDSLTTMHRVLSRHLDDFQYPYNIVTNEKCSLSRMVLASKERR